MTSPVQLGFAEEEGGLGGSARSLFSNPDYREWDGGKLGGRPDWLNPQHLPATQLLQCRTCGDQLSFLMQLYCPADDDGEDEGEGNGGGNEDAFHRALYVFCCRRGDCVVPSTLTSEVEGQEGQAAAHPCGFFKVLRCQLPRVNSLYPSDPDGAEGDRACAVRREELAAKLCVICGQHAPHSCSRCHAVHYCSRGHQREDWKAGHKQACGLTSGEEQKKQQWRKQRRSKFVWPEFDVVVEAEEEEEEEEEGEEGEEMDEKRRDQPTGEEEVLLRQEEFSKVSVGCVTVDPGDLDDDTIEQEDLDKITGAHLGAGSLAKDALMQEFLSRTARAPEQCVRYERWSSCRREGGEPVDSQPLWAGQRGALSNPDTSVPPCERCGAARKFEFQVMPQVLYYLGVDANASAAALREGHAPKSLDWGTVAIYTCSRSCSVGAGDDACGAYAEEFAWIQEPADRTDPAQEEEDEDEEEEDEEGGCEEQKKELR